MIAPIARSAIAAYRSQLTRTGPGPKTIDTLTRNQQAYFQEIQDFSCSAVDLAWSDMTHKCLARVEVGVMSV